MADKTLAGSSKALAGGNVPGGTQDLGAAPCLSPAQIAMALSGSGELPTGDDAALCLETLQRVVSTLASPVATGLDYPPFALSPHESASLAVLALQGTDAIVERLGDRGTLCAETVLHLSLAITQALHELTSMADTPIDTQPPDQLSGL